MAPTLIYFPIAGRGELIRLIAKVGGLGKLQELPAVPDGLTAKDFGSTGSLPVFMDGDLKINESGAIETYVSLIAPKYKDLTPKQRAKDAQFCQLKESCIAAFARPLFRMTPQERASGAKKDEYLALFEKHFSVMEGILPEDGFINGLDFPTPADLAIVNICEGYMPFGSAYKHAGLKLAEAYPKLSAHNERVKAVPEVAKALEESTYLKSAFPTF